MTVIRRVGAVIGLILGLSVLAASQPSVQRPVFQPSMDKTGGGSIKGRIVLPNGSYVAENIKVTLLNLRETVAIIYTDNQGQFEFRNLAPANYQLEIEADRRKFDAKTEMVQVFRGAPTVVSIALKEKETTGTNSAGAVSLSEIDRNVPDKAKKEFAKASQLLNEGKREAAMAHLRQAIALYDRYVMARNDLATLLLAEGKLDDAEEQLRVAVQLDPKAFNPALNLGIVLVNKHEFAEALTVLQQANSLQANSPAVHLYLGLAGLGVEDFEIAESNFKEAHTLGGPPFALALFHLGQLYLSKGDKESAIKSFQLYLREVPDAANREQVRQTIAMLR